MNIPSTRRAELELVRASSASRADAYCTWRGATGFAATDDWLHDLMLLEDTMLVPGIHSPPQSKVS